MASGTSRFDQASFDRPRLLRHLGRGVARRISARSACRGYGRGSRDRPRSTAQGPSLQRSCACSEPAEAEIEDVDEVMGVVPGDAVARLRRAHGFEQRDVRAPTATSCCGDFAEAARLRGADGVIGFARVLDGRGRQARGRAGVANRRRLGSSAAWRGERQSRTMPRLVFWPTAAAVASTASRMRAPTGSPARPIAGAAARALASKSAMRHAMTIAKAMHIAGLQRVELGKAGVMKGSSDRLGLVRGPVTRPLGLCGRVAGSAASRKASTTMIGDRARASRAAIRSRPAWSSPRAPGSVRRGAWMISTPA